MKLLNREELHRAQAEELQQRDQQLLHEQVLQQNWELREAHQKSTIEIEELKKFQSSTFDTMARRRSVEHHDTIMELIGKIPELRETNSRTLCFRSSRPRRTLARRTVGGSGLTEGPNISLLEVVGVGLITCEGVGLVKRVNTLLGGLHRFVTNLQGSGRSATGK